VNLKVGAFMIDEMSFFPKDDNLGVLKSIVCAGVRVCM